MKIQKPRFTHFAQLLMDTAPLELSKPAVLKELAKEPLLYSEINEKLKNDQDITFLAVQSWPDNISLVPAQYLDNEDLIKIAVEKKATLITHASERIRDNYEIMQLVVSKNAMMIRYASERLRNDKEFNMLVLENGAWALEHCSILIRNICHSHLQVENISLLQQAIEKDRFANYLKDSLNNNEKTSNIKKIKI